ncbi:hypothetical protein A3A20_01760 [Candidatus Wolfebacteria bacterium RIFCSPLOWO2_01_FULL_45_19]|uniref:starch synthase n=1 Tax=Candidatus Wolfebacteria bacterium RIFCSPLOWO2_01_FULL_45_19 TaxID=1802557 RepID=A0A1F8DSS1_9BACT|nr:MAG: Alpha-glucan phosphorylase [Parcubacteria group bacterium GW2011_GWB1_45_9]OGM91644.1 MAG: hypothetical protein A3A20_01760 [Candidatus Wolfebacteria bacterium RIFCSPLOWO2_01_FULL_45_19]
MGNLKVAFLTMEMLIGELSEPLRGANFKGGLGILAGDIARNFKEVGINAMCFVPFYDRPWFAKDTRLDYNKFGSFPIEIAINGHKFEVNAHKAFCGAQDVFGLSHPEIFDVLYTDDRQKRLLQEVLLAIVVPRMLKAANFAPDVVWLNESHTALIIPHLKEDPFFARTKILFTTHTPVQAGMEKFYDYNFDKLELAHQLYRDAFINNGVLDLTRGAMVLSDAVNAVSEEHREVTKRMFSGFADKITGIRNGSDARFWTHKSTSYLVNRKIIIELDDLMEIHAQARGEVLALANKLSGLALSEKKPTAWFVRRFAGYKNLYPMLEPILPAICAERGSYVNTNLGVLEGLGMQIVGAGVAPETDGYCLGWMSEFTRLARDVFQGRFAFIPQYTTELLQAGAWGSDVWLATPEPGLEACGTSDQRAILNGIPVITSRTGGPMEYLEEFNPESANGCGFFIDPYNSRTLYEKLRIFSSLWYAWKEQGDERYPTLKLNAFGKRHELDIVTCLEKYKQLMFSTAR